MLLNLSRCSRRSADQAPLSSCARRPPPPQARLQRCGRGALGQHGGKVTRAPPAPAACKSSILTLQGHGVCRARRGRPAATCRTPTALGLRERPFGEGRGARIFDAPPPGKWPQPTTTLSSGPGGRRTLLKLRVGPSRVRLPAAPLRRKLLSGSGRGGPGGHVEQECCRGMLFLQVGGSLL